MRNVILINIGLWLFLLVLFSTTELPGKTLFWTSLHNAGHGLAMSFAALVGIVTIARQAPSLAKTLYWAIPLALLGLSVLIEVVQFATGRGASLSDLVMDSAGIIAGTCLSAIICLKANPLIKVVYGLIGIVLLAFCVRMPAYYFIAEKLSPTLPTLENFEGLAARGRLLGDNAEISIDEYQNIWLQNAGNSMRVTYSPAQWPYARITNPARDWSNYNHLSLEAFNNQKTDVRLNIRVDYQSTTPKRAFMVARRTLPPGHSTINVSYAELAKENYESEPDFKQIKGIMLYLSSPVNPVTLYFDTLRLH